MKFKELEIGKEFTFAFESKTSWRYKKVSKDSIQCIGAPLTNKNAVGIIHHIGKYHLVEEGVYNVK